MSDVHLRPIQEGDLDELSRFHTDPEALSEFEWTGFKDPQAFRRRWEEDGWIAKDRTDSTWLAVAVADTALAGIVNWKDSSRWPPSGAVFDIGIALLPEHRGMGLGTAAQQLLVGYLFDNTTVHRLQAFTEVDNDAEQHALEKIAFQREGIVRQLFFRRGQWRDSVLYSRLRDDGVTLG